MIASLVLGCLRIPDSAREPDQCRILVPYARLRPQSLTFGLQCHSILLYFQICPHPMDGASPDWWCPDLVPVLHPASLLPLLLPKWLNLCGTPSKGGRSRAPSQSAVNTPTSPLVD